MLALFGHRATQTRHCRWGELKPEQKNHRVKEFRPEKNPKQNIQLNKNPRGKHKLIGRNFFVSKLMTVNAVHLER